MTELISEFQIIDTYSLIHSFGDGASIFFLQEGRCMYK